MKTKPTSSIIGLLKNIPVVETCETDNHGNLRVKAGGQSYFLQVLNLPNGYPGHIKQVVEGFQKAQNAYRIVCVPFMADKAASICREFNVGYYDKAGNCHVAFGPVYVEVSGRKNPGAQSRGMKSVFERSSVVSSKILRVLVASPDRIWKTEELANLAGCSLGQIAKVKKFLESHDWIIRTNKGFKLSQLDEMLIKWAEVYNARKNDTVECYVLGSLPEIERKLEDIGQLGGPASWLTGFSGGNRYSPTVRYSKIHAYVQEQDADELIKQLGGSRVESGANLSFIVPYDDCVLINSRVIKNSQVVSPIQIYLDCRNLKSRGDEMAEGILKVMKS